MCERSSKCTKPVQKSVWLTGLPVAGTIILSVLYRKTAYEVFLSLAITFGTISYHVIMRLLVGLIFRIMMQNRADYKKRWYHVSRHEMAVYRKLNIKNWKRRMPTYDRTLFDPRIHTWEEIAQAIVTSIFAAGCDMLFVMMQRYNRQRIVMTLKRESIRKSLR